MLAHTAFSFLFFFFSLSAWLILQGIPVQTCEQWLLACTYCCAIFGGCSAARCLSISRVKYLCPAIEYRWTMATEKTNEGQKKKRLHVVLSRQMVLLCAGK